MAVRISRPCDECPWRKDAQPGRFTPERWDTLRETCHDQERGSAPLGAPLFACHKTDEGKERICAGWLAVEGGGHVSARLMVALGEIPGEALSSGAGWPELFGSYEETSSHDLSGWVE